MSTMIIEVYDAFISAGTDEQKARSAAQAINEKDKQLVTKSDVESEIKGIEGEIKGVRGEIKGVRGEIRGVRSETKSLRGFMYFSLGSMGAGIAYLAALTHSIIDKL